VSRCTFVETLNDRDEYIAEVFKNAKIVCFRESSQNQGTEKGRLIAHYGHINLLSFNNAKLNYCNRSSLRLCIT